MYNLLRGLAEIIEALSGFLNCIFTHQDRKNKLVHQKKESFIHELDALPLYPVSEKSEANIYIGYKHEDRELTHYLVLRNRGNDNAYQVDVKVLNRPNMILQKKYLPLKYIEPGEDCPLCLALEIPVPPMIDVEVTWRNNTGDLVTKSKRLLISW